MAAVAQEHSSSSPSPRAEPIWEPRLKFRRPAIEQGFKMPRFAGEYYMWPEEYELLAKYVGLSQGDYLEIGSMCGIIAVSFAEKYPSRAFYCVDNFSAGHATIAGSKGVFLKNVKDHGVTNVKLIEGDSLQILPSLEHSFGVAFVDANHSYDYVMADAVNCWRLLQTNGVLLFHDYDCVPETTSAVDHFTLKYRAPLVEAVSGLAVVRKVAESSEHQIFAGKGLQHFQDELREAELQLEKMKLECANFREQVTAIENSLGWRTINRLRRIRDAIAPSGTNRRRLYEYTHSLLRRS